MAENERITNERCYEGYYHSHYHSQYGFTVLEKAQSSIAEHIDLHDETIDSRLNCRVVNSMYNGGSRSQFRTQRWKIAIRPHLPVGELVRKDGDSISQFKSIIAVI